MNHCAATVWGSQVKSGLLILMPVLALLLEVKDEADIFCLYIDTYILKQRPPVFAAISSE